METDAACVPRVAQPIEFSAKAGDFWLESAATNNWIDSEIFPPFAPSAQAASCTKSLSMSAQVRARLLADIYAARISAGDATISTSPVATS
jgi:hypothetical protein